MVAKNNVQPHNAVWGEFFAHIFTHKIFASLKDNNNNSLSSFTNFL